MGYEEITKDDPKGTAVKKVISKYAYYKSKRRSTWEASAEKSLRFYFGDQWTNDDKAYMEQQKRPPAVFNHCLPAVDLIVGHQLHNRIDYVASPVDMYADPALADIITSAIKHIENSNNATLERRFQFLDGLITGIGVIENWFDTEQDIEGEVKTTQRSPWRYYLDPDFEKYDFSDGKCVIREDWMTSEDVRRIYGKKVAAQLPGILTGGYGEELPINTVRPTWNDEPTNDYGNLDPDYGYTGKTDDELYAMGYDKEYELYRVVEEYTKVWKEVKKYRDSMGNIVNKDDLLDGEEETAEYITTRWEPHIQLTTVICETILAVDRQKLPNTEFYQLFNFFFPYFVNGRYMGILENVFFPQEEINKVHSSLIHILNTMSRGGMFYQTGAIDKEYEPDIEELLGRPTPVIKFNELYNEHGQPNYVRQGIQEPPQSFFKVIEGEDYRIKYITGANDAIQGVPDKAESGRSKITDITQASVRLSGIIENFRETQKLCGKAYLWWIQNYYTGERFIRIRGDEQGRDPQAFILNERIYGQIANDVTIGKYDVVLKQEGKTDTERDRMFWKLTELARVLGPMYAPVIASLVLENSDLPHKDRIMQQVNQIQQMQQQQMMTGGGVPAQRGGTVQSAPRPGRGLRRPPTEIRENELANQRQF